MTLTTFMTLLDSHACRDRQASATDLKLTRLFIIQLASTNNMAMIQLSFTSSKWNMDEIVGLKFHIHIIPIYIRKIFFENLGTLNFCKGV